MQNYGLYLEDCEDYEVEETHLKGLEPVARVH